MIEDDTPVLVGVWRGDNMRYILMALSQMGYTTATKIRVQKGRLIIKNLFERQVIQVGEQIWLPYVNEPKDEGATGENPESNSGGSQGRIEELRRDSGGEKEKPQGSNEGP
jgi:hypothetical protein